MGIINLWIQIKCLLSKWLFRILNEDSTLQILLWNKYLSSECLSQVHIRPGYSNFWKGLLKVREDFLGCGTFKIKDGSQTRFWEDTWVDTKPLKDQFPNLYNIVHCPHDTVANVIHQTPLNVSFRRALVVDKLIAWHNLIAKLSSQTTFEWKGYFYLELT